MTRFLRREEIRVPLRSGFAHNRGGFDLSSRCGTALSRGLVIHQPPDGRLMNGRSDRI